MFTIIISSYFSIFEHSSSPLSSCFFFFKFVGNIIKVTLAQSLDHHFHHPEKNKQPVSKLIVTGQSNDYWHAEKSRKTQRDRETRTMCTAFLQETPRKRVEL